MYYIDNAKLIEQVRQYPWLYDRATTDYRDSRKKIHTWNHIAAKLNTSSRECQARWRGLRDRYVKEMKKMKNYSYYRSIWSLMSEMSFLENLISHRMTEKPQIDDIRNMSGHAHRDIGSSSCVLPNALTEEGNEAMIFEIEDMKDAEEIEEKYIPPVVLHDDEVPADDLIDSVAEDDTDGTSIIIPTSEPLPAEIYSDSSSHAEDRIVIPTKRARRDSDSMLSSILKTPCTLDKSPNTNGNSSKNEKEDKQNERAVRRKMNLKRKTANIVKEQSLSKATLELKDDERAFEVKQNELRLAMEENEQSAQFVIAEEEARVKLEGAEKERALKEKERLTKLALYEKEKLQHIELEPRRLALEEKRLEIQLKQVEIDERRVALEERRMAFEEQRQVPEQNHWLKMEGLVQETLGCLTKMLNTIRDSAVKGAEAMMQMMSQVMSQQQTLMNIISQEKLGEAKTS